ncbi:MAG: hypothetical protein ACOYNF_00460, partial [Rhodoferax sp.]
MTAHDGLPELLEDLDPQADLVQRHLWLIRLLAWVRGDRSSVAACLARLTLLLDVLQQRAPARQQVQLWWRICSIRWMPPACWQTTVLP